jgi:hypothetical protein
VGEHHHNNHVTDAVVPTTVSTFLQLLVLLTGHHCLPASHCLWQCKLVSRVVYVILFVFCTKSKTFLLRYLTVRALTKVPSSGKAGLLCCQSELTEHPLLLTLVNMLSHFLFWNSYINKCGIEVVSESSLQIQ